MLFDDTSRERERERERRRKKRSSASDDEDAVVVGETALGHRGRGKELLDTVHKLENDDKILTTTTTRKERGKRHTNSTAAGREDDDDDGAQKNNRRGKRRKRRNCWVRRREARSTAPTETMEEEEEENTKKNNGTRRINDDDDQVIDDNGIDATMGGTTPRLTSRRRRRSTPSRQNAKGTPKDEKQVERVVSLVRLILTSKKVKEDKVPALIAPNLYLGSIGAGAGEEQIKEKGITHVLTVARGFEIKNVEGVKYMTVEVADRPDADIRSHFPQCFEFISGAVKSGGNILVHCFAGRSRSASVRGRTSCVTKTSGWTKL